MGAYDLTDLLLYAKFRKLKKICSENEQDLSYADNHPTVKSQELIEEVKKDDITPKNAINYILNGGLSSSIERTAQEMLHCLSVDDIYFQNYALHLVRKDGLNLKLSNASRDTAHIVVQGKKTHAEFYRNLDASPSGISLDALITNSGGKLSLLERTRIMMRSFDYWYSQKMIQEPNTPARKVGGTMLVLAGMATFVLANQIDYDSLQIFNSPKPAQGVLVGVGIMSAYVGLTISGYYQKSDKPPLYIQQNS